MINDTLRIRPEVLDQINAIKKPPKILICINTHRSMNPFFVNSMFYMLEYMHRTHLQYEISSHTGVSNLCGGRQNRVQEAIESNCTHMFCVDDDMAFGMDIIHKMIDEMNKLSLSGKTRIAMGVNACRKSPAGLSYTAKGIGSPEFLKSKGKKGVAPVSRCGLGIFLIETSILRDIPEPHFEVVWTPNVSLYDHAQHMMDLLEKEIDDAWYVERDNILEKIKSEKFDKKEHQGEDYYFIKKLISHGVEVFVDQDISQTLGHAGEYVYTFGSYKDPDAASS